MNTKEVSDLIKSTITAHKASRKSLAEAINNMLSELPKGTLITTSNGHKVEKRKVYCGCSQWANRNWDVTGSELAILIDGYLLVDLDISVFDGSNLHYRKTPLYLDSDGEGDKLTLAKSALLREVANELPEALAKWIEAKRAETTANIAALGAIAS